jgi:hypothetical protein
MLIKAYAIPQLCETAGEVNAPVISHSYEVLDVFHNPREAVPLPRG